MTKEELENLLKKYPAYRISLHGVKVRDFPRGRTNVFLLSEENRSWLYFEKMVGEISIELYSVDICAVQEEKKEEKKEEKETEGKRG